MGNIHPLSIYPNSKTTVEPPANEFTLSIDLENHGRCHRCGIQTHNEKQGLFSLRSVLVPLTNDHVINGRCISCNPLSAKGNADTDSIQDAARDADNEASPARNSVSSLPVTTRSQDLGTFEIGVCALVLKNKMLIAGSTVLILVALVLGIVFGVFGNDLNLIASNTTASITNPTSTNVPNLAIAEYDGGYGAPTCSQVSSSCDSGPFLLAGGGPNEAHFPGNTIDGCWGDMFATYHEDSSIDRIIVRTVDMMDFKPGKKVQIEAKIWAVAERDATSIHFYYASDVTDVSWQFIETVSKLPAGESSVSTEYTLPNGSLQAVRVVCRYYNIIPNPCPSGDDVDDLVFAVG